MQLSTKSLHLQIQFSSIYYHREMTPNERIKQIRTYRRATDAELASKAGISTAEVSLVETRMRRRKSETPLGIAAVSKGSTSYILSEPRGHSPIEEALAKESLQVFLRDGKLPAQEKNVLRDMSERPSTSVTVMGWRGFIANLLMFR